MQADLKATLSGVLENVLEQFAFMFCEPVEFDQVPVPDEPLLQASMTYSGPSTGSLAIAVPQALAAEVAANALGIDDEEESGAASHDALRELLNVICGQMLTAIAGEEPVFDLSIPEVTPCDGEAWQAMAADDKTAHFSVEDYPFLLRVEAPE